MEITKNDILKHYFASILVYGIVLLLVYICPILNKEIKFQYLNYMFILVSYYILYVIFALPIFFKFKPETILYSRNLTIIRYIKRLFKKCNNTEEQIKNLEPSETEKQSILILFIQTFFGVYCLNLLCNHFLPAIDYNYDFLKTLYSEASKYALTDGFFMGIAQFIDDTYDVWVNIILTIITIIFAFSYLTESDIFKNRIKNADVTPLGILSCIICFAPFIILTNQILPIYSENIIEMENLWVRITLKTVIILANIGSLAAIIKLGTKSGNLTNRGIETGFPYNIIRHPDYSMQMIYLICTMIPIYFLSGLTIFNKIVYSIGILCWLGIYFIRAITEERNLMQDEKYKQYAEKVKYRFIPKLL